MRGKAREANSRYCSNCLYVCEQAAMGEIPNLGRIVVINQGPIYGVSFYVGSEADEFFGEDRLEYVGAHEYKGVNHFEPEAGSDPIEVEVTVATRREERAFKAAPGAAGVFIADYFRRCGLGHTVEVGSYQPPSPQEDDDEEFVFGVRVPEWR